MGRMQGTIKKLVTDKGFGFVRGADGKEYFFHRSALSRESIPYEDLKEGRTEVDFEPMQAEKGLRAIDVHTR